MRKLTNINHAVFVAFLYFFRAHISSTGDDGALESRINIEDFENTSSSLKEIARSSYKLSHLIAIELRHITVHADES